MSQERYGIAEWYGNNFMTLSVPDRLELAAHALRDETSDAPCCPFQKQQRCQKAGGVCAIRKYAGRNGRIVKPIGDMVVTCPRRFEQDDLVLSWLADIVGIEPSRAHFAMEVPLMQHGKTGKLAGKSDFVIAESRHGRLVWHGLENQAVYFSGVKMEHDFLVLNNDEQEQAPFPQKVRRPDWRSSSMKRLMPQLQIKGSTLRRWGAKLAVCVDRHFFDYIGGPSSQPSRDLDLGDVIWMVPEFKDAGSGCHRMSRGHWEVMTLEDTATRLNADKTVTKSAFEESLHQKLRPLSPPGRRGTELG